MNFPSPKAPVAPFGMSEDRLRILRHAARKVVFERGTSLDLEHITRMAGVSVARGLELFGSNEGLREQLYLHKEYCLNAIFQREVAKLPKGADPKEHMRCVLMSYFLLSVEEPDFFLVNLAFEAEAGERGENRGLEAILSRPFIAAAMEWGRDVMIAEGRDPEDPACAALAITGFAAVHGYAHLCVYSNSRHLVATAKKQTMSAILDILFWGLDLYFTDDDVDWLEPVGPVPSEFVAPGSWEELPRDSAESKRECLIRSGVQRFHDESLQAVSLVKEAERTGVSLSEAKAFFDGDADFLNAIEMELEQQMLFCIDEQVRVLGPEATSLNRLKATGLGAMVWAMKDPVGMLAFSQVISGSVVPAGGGMTGSSERPNVVAGAILSAFGELLPEDRRLDEWNTYVKVFTVWSACHGIIHLTAAGAARSMSEKAKFEIAGTVMDLTISAVVERFGLDNSSVSPSHWVI